MIDAKPNENLAMPPKFVVGRVYDRWPEINDPYGGSRQSGISTSRQTAAIFLFTGDTGEQYGYQDSFDENGVFWYTGEGQVGDMKFDKGNQAIVEHAIAGRALHVFRTLGKAKGQEYIGEFTYASHEFKQGPDREGNQRQLIVFHLIPVELIPDESITAYETDVENQQDAISLKEARIRAVLALSPTEQVGTSQVLRTQYKRSKTIRDYVFRRANGHCESCKKSAPFNRVNGTPYLEPHHTTRVSDGGLDHPRHVGAICPSCHREIHYGEKGNIRNVELIAWLDSVESLQDTVRVI